MTEPLSTGQLEHAADLITQADALIVAAGAGNPDGTRSLDASASAESDMASGDFSVRNSGVREELRAAYKTLIQTLFYKAEQYVEDTEKADKFVGETRAELAKQLQELRDGPMGLSRQLNEQFYKRNNKPASTEQLAEFDAVASALVEGRGLATDWKNPTIGNGKRFQLGKGRWTSEALEKISEIYKAVRGRSGFNSEKTGVSDSLRSYISRYEKRLGMLAAANNAETKTKQVPTSFSMDAKSLDQGRGMDYWTSPHEMAARAFQGYVEDMITAKDGKSPFLNYAPENVGLMTPWGVKLPYPSGAERKAMNKAFDAFVNTIQTKETDKGVAMFSRIQDVTSNAVAQWRVSLKAAASNPQAKGPNMVTPMVLRMMGAEAEKLVLPRTYLKTIISTHSDVPMHVFESLPAMLADPLFIIPHKDGGLRVFVQAETDKGEPIAVGVSVGTDGRIHTVTPMHNQFGQTGQVRMYSAVARATGKIYARNKEALALARASSAAAPGTIPLHSGSVSKLTVITQDDVVKSIEKKGNKGPGFSRGTNATGQQFKPLANQSTAKALNATLVNYGLGQDWENAYEAVKLPDTLSGVREAVQAAFGRDVRPVAPTESRFNIFNGVYIPSQPDAVYVNVAADVGFLNIAGHELWHVIKRQRPELIDWYLKLAKSNRSAMKRLIQRKGIAGFNEDAGRVLAGFVYSNARQTASSLHMGEMTNLPAGFFLRPNFP